MCRYIGDDRSTSRSSIATQQPIVEVPMSLRNKVIQNLLVEGSQPSADRDEQIIVENACRQLRPEILDRVTLNKQARLLDSLLDEKKRYLPISVGKSAEESEMYTGYYGLMWNTIGVDGADKSVYHQEKNREREKVADCICHVIMGHSKPEMKVLASSLVHNSGKIYRLLIDSTSSTASIRVIKSLFGIDTTNESFQGNYIIMGGGRINENCMYYYIVYILYLYWSIYHEYDRTAYTFKYGRPTFPVPPRKTTRLLIDYLACPRESIIEILSYLRRGAVPAEWRVIVATFKEKELKRCKARERIC